MILKEKSQNLESTLNVVRSELTQYINQEMLYKEKIMHLKSLNQDMS